MTISNNKSILFKEFACILYTPSFALISSTYFTTFLRSCQNAKFYDFLVKHLRNVGRRCFRKSGAVAASLWGIPILSDSVGAAFYSFGRQTMLDPLSTLCTYFLPQKTWQSAKTRFPAINCDVSRAVSRGGAASFRTKNGGTSSSEQHLRVFASEPEFHGNQIK